MSYSLDSGAIEKVQTLVLSQFLEEKLSSVDCPAAVIPAGASIESLERLSLDRFRFRGKMQTASIEDFARYSTGYAEEGTRCFINADEMRAVSVFNLGTLVNPGHADNTALLALKKTAPYSSLLSINGERHTQKELAEWLEDWAENLLGFDAEGAVLDAKRSAAAIRKISIESIQKADFEDQDFSGKRSLMESVEARTQDIMPVAFEFKCVPFEGLNERPFKLRLSIIGGDRPTLVLRIVQLEAHQEDMAVEFRDLLVEKFKDSQVETFIGAFTA